MNCSEKSLFTFCEQVFTKMGFSHDDAWQASDILIRAELRGIHTHGLVRLPEYVKLWKKGKINTRPEIRIINETPSTMLIDADGSLGLVVAPKAMQKAIDKASEVGTGWVAVRNSKHFGIAGYYAMMALEREMIGITMTNSQPLVAPTFSLRLMIGTNPIAVAIPASTEPPFVADFATSSIARGKLDDLSEKGKDVPEGLVQDQYGAPSTRPDILTDGGAILPLGGDREHGSHKGYCLSAIVDIMSAVLSGANFGPAVVPSLEYIKSTGKDKDKGMGHFFGAMRIDAFQTAKEFKSQMDQWIRTFRNAESVIGQERVIIPGDPEREAELKYLKTGIPIPDKQLSIYKRLGEEMGGITFDCKPVH